MQLLLSLACALALHALTATSNPLFARADTCGSACVPKPVKSDLKFDDIPTAPESDFTQLGLPGGVATVSNGFKFYQDSTWYVVSCTHFPVTNPYYKSCGAGSTKSLWTPGDTPAPVSTFSGPALFDIDSFFITPVVFATRQVTLKVSGKYITGGQAPCYETKITTDVRTAVKGLRAKGFKMLSEFQVRVVDDGGVSVAYAIDDLAVRKWETSCGGVAGDQYD